MADLVKKEVYVKEYQQKLSKAKVVIFANCEGITVEQINILRKTIRGLGDEVRVVKNTLVTRALKNLNLDQAGKFMTGATALTIGYSDPIAPVKALFEFADKAKKFSFKGGILEGKVLSVKDLENLSKLPSRQTLLGMLVSTMIAPIRNAVSVFQGPIRKLVYAIEALRQKKEKESPA